MSIFRGLGTILNSGLEYAARKQDGAGSSGDVAAPGKKRTLKGGKTCTPCAAVANVNHVRKAYGIDK